MSLDISKIVGNDKLKKLAEECDTNKKDGNLDAIEFSVFSTKALNGGVKEYGENLYEVLGLYTTNPQVDSKKAEDTPTDVVNNRLDALLEEGMDISKAMKKLKKSLKKDGLLENPEYQKAYENLENELVTARVSSLSMFDASNRKDVEKLLKKEGLWDEYSEKALDRKFYQPKINKIKENVEQKKTQSKADVEKAIGAETLELLVNAGLVSQAKADENSNEMLDLTNLSNLIKSYVGSDYTANRSFKDFEPIEEFDAIRDMLETKLNIKKLSKSETKDLIKLCGYEVDNKFGYNWWRGITGALTGAGASAVHAFNNIKAEDSVNEINITVESILNGERLPGPFTEELVQTLIAAGYEASTDGNTLNIKEIIPGFDVLINDMASPIGLAKTCICAAVGALQGIERNAEVPLIEKTVPDFAETKEEYLKYIKNRLTDDGKEEYLPAITFLVQSFDNNGTWDKAGYEQALKKMAGSCSVLNSKELENGLVDMLSTDAVATKSQIKEPEINEPKPVITVKTRDIVDTKTEKIVVDVPVVDGSKTSWTKLAESYDCLVNKYGLSDAIRMVKIAQAITDNNYSQERMENLLKLSKKGASHLKNEKGFDYKVYVDVLKSTSLPKLEKDSSGNYIAGTGVKVPSNLADCDRKTDMDLIAPKADGEIVQTSPKHAIDVGTKVTTTKRYEYEDENGVKEYQDKNRRDNQVVIKIVKNHDREVKVETNN